MSLFIIAVIRGAEEKPTVYLINNGIKTEVSVEKHADKTYAIHELITLNHRKWQWIRLEIRGQKCELLGYINPVYKGKKESVCRTFGEIVDNLDQCAEN